jgi:hypothetical protein
MMDMGLWDLKLPSFPTTIFIQHSLVVYKTFFSSITSDSLSSLLSYFEVNVVKIRTEVYFGHHFYIYDMRWSLIFVVPILRTASEGALSLMDEAFYR